MKEEEIQAIHRYRVQYLGLEEVRSQEDLTTREIIDLNDQQNKIKQKIFNLIFYPRG